jgi:hypothetical protein
MKILTARDVDDCFFRTGLLPAQALAYRCHIRLLARELEHDQADAVPSRSLIVNEVLKPVALAGRVVHNVHQ